MFWEHDQDEILSLEGKSRWTDWNQFKVDLRGHWNETIDEGGSHKDQRFWEYLQKYERIAPSYLKSPPTVGDIRDRDKKATRELLIAGGILSLFLLVVGSLLWEQGVAPMLGHLGFIEYKSPSQERYERFLSGVKECTPQKTVSTGSVRDIPPFQVFVCPGGQEKIWAHKIEVIKRAENGAWVLEP